MNRLAELYHRIHDFDEHGDMDDSVQAIFELEAEAVPEWLPELHEWLARPENFYLREAAAPAVARLEGIRALPALLHALQLGTAEGHDNDSLQAVITDLVCSSPDEARPVLLAMAAAASAEKRGHAAWLLGFIHSHIDPAILLTLAHDPAASVRRAACGSLGSCKGSQEAFDGLCQALGEADEQVRISAISALGYLGDPHALLLLRPLQGAASPRLQGMLEYSVGLLQK